MNIQDVKQQILNINRQYQDDESYINAHNLIDMAKDSGKVAGFAGQVLETVCNNHKASEKQAYIIARGIVESGLDLTDLEEAAKDALITKSLKR